MPAKFVSNTSCQIDRGNSVYNKIELGDAVFLDELIELLALAAYILVNNNSVAVSDFAVEKMSLTIWQEVIDKNFSGTFLVTQATLSIMKRCANSVFNFCIVAVPAKARLTKLERLFTMSRRAS